MPRFSAVIDTPHGTIGPDVIDAPDLQAALERARSLAADLARDALRHASDADVWHLRLSDEAGRTVGEVPLAAHGVAAALDGDKHRQG